MRSDVVPLAHSGLEEDTAPLWRALADPTRRRILDLLRERPRVTGEVARAVTNGCPHQPPVSLVSAANTAAGVPAISMSCAMSMVGWIASMCLPSASTVSCSRSSADANPAAAGSAHRR